MAKDRKKGILKGIEPDSKSQVTMLYENEKLIKVTSVVISTQHSKDLNQEKVREAIENEVPGDLLSIDLRNVIDSVGEITGEISNDEMLGNIFSNFCIGK